MKKLLTLLIAGLLIPLLFIAFKPHEKSEPQANDYLVIAWNDLGMHCANQDFSNMCILPPYNNQTAHLILKGDQTTMPQVIGEGGGYYVTYEIPGNTYSVGKTNFWSYDLHIFGVDLPDNIGLTGFGLTGTMLDTTDYFYATGIPVTPYPDSSLTVPDPYQLTLIKAYDGGNNLLAQTQSVIPVSNEINCVSSGCHSSEMNILEEHESGTFNINDRPIFCASCHADPALGTPGVPGVPVFSQAIHQKHGGETNDCYKCHPGPNTQCFRDIMHTSGLTCQDCHGSVSNVGNTIESGRIPWLQEPSCGAAACHGSNYAEEPGKLFRQSKGHGGLFCSTCHGSPHAILPSENARDNIQNISLQGYAGTLSNCEVCHGYIPAAPGPHGYNPLGIQPISTEIPGKDEILPNYPNPCSYMTQIPYRISAEGNISLEVYSIRGEKIKTLVNNRLAPGEYRAEFYAAGLPAGTYLCVLANGDARDYLKIVIAR
jgi:hypothetical protein